MTHSGELLSAFLDGELVAAEQSAVVAHVAQCPHCRDELAELDSARTAVRSMPLLDPPADLAPISIDRESPRRRRHLARYAAVAAALVAGVIGLGALRGGPDAALVDFDDAVDQHIARVSVERGVPAVKVVSGVNR